MSEPTQEPTKAELKEFLDALRGHADAGIVQAWLDAGKDIEQRIPTPGFNGWNETPLIMASMWGQTEIVKTLMAAKADIEALDYSDHTPLMKAAMNGRLDICKLLVEAGANVKYESNVNRRTALDHAKIQGKKDCIEFLDPLTPGDIGEPAYYAQRAKEREAMRAEMAAKETAAA